LFDFARFENVEVYSLQKGNGEKELENLPEGIKIINLGTTFNNFADTAAAVENLDLVITVDTSISHLAGALGKTAWNLIPYPGDWKWGINTDTSYWYSKHRLFRQKELGKWDEPINKALMGGNINALIFFILTVFYYCFFVKKEQTLSSICLTIGTVLKIYPLFLLILEVFNKNAKGLISKYVSFMILVTSFSESFSVSQYTLSF
jgi:hypothetical protein